MRGRYSQITGRRLFIVLGQGQVAPELLQMRGHDCPSEGLRPCGVSSLTLSVIPIAASTQPHLAMCETFLMQPGISTWGEISSR